MQVGRQIWASLGLACIFSLGSCGGANAPQSDYSANGGSTSTTGGTTVEDGPFRVSLEMTGDTLQDFLVTIKAKGNPDFTTPRSTVEAFCVLMSRESGLIAMADRVNDRYEEVINQSLANAERVLFWDEIFKETEEHRQQQRREKAKLDRSKPELAPSTFKIISETPIDDGTHRVSVEYFEESAHLDDARIWGAKLTITRQSRFTCKKRSNGTWAIAAAEHRYMPPDGSSREWRAKKNMLASLFSAASRLGLEKLPSPFQSGSAESSAKAIIDALFLIKRLPLYLGGARWAEACLPLLTDFFTDEYVAEGRAKAAPAPSAREARTIDRVAREAESTVVTFAALEGRRGVEKPVFKLKQFGNNWKVTEVGILKVSSNDDGTTSEEYTKLEYVYELLFY